ncbi:MAG: DUF3325 domain-containing protein [Delftia acidovorans]|jgi:hypothetical protein|nr:DUF3325 domain-containing protein [Delftia acidovorans]
MSTLHASVMALALAFSGMAALAFAMDRHYEQLTGARELPVRRGLLLRCLGAALLAACLLPVLRTWGPTVGTVAWLGFVSAGALAAVAGISAHARWAARMACMAAALAAVDLAWLVSGFGT